jgi:low affinity Fe/Cu permease
MTESCRVAQTQSNGNSLKTGIFDELARKVACASGKPLTFGSAVALIIVWAITGPIYKYNDTWQLVINTGTTIITFLMVFLIQNTQNRDAAAVQLKLDELIRSMQGAHNSAMALEDKPQEELEEIKAEYHAIAVAEETPT